MRSKPAGQLLFCPSEEHESIREELQRLGPNLEVLKTRTANTQMCLKTEPMWEIKSTYHQILGKFRDKSDWSWKQKSLVVDLSDSRSLAGARVLRLFLVKFGRQDEDGLIQERKQSPLPRQPGGEGALQPR